MDLILWRHAEAEDGVPDEARRLTAKGEKQAARMAQWLRQWLPDDYQVLTSPARRARQTAQALCDDFEIVAAIGTGAAPRDLLKASGWPKNGTVVLVGHQPVLGQTAAWLLSGSEAEWPIKKGAIWWLRQRDGEIALRAVMAPDML
ncbi:MAG: histidine phosphatase family protein [Pseudomonadota bacterium]